MNKTKTFETERLILRKFKLSDAEDMFKNYTNSEKVCEFLTWAPHGKIENTKLYLKNIVLPRYKNEDELVWALQLKETGDVIGCFDVCSQKQSKNRMMLGWVLSEKYWGQGLMPEAGKTLIPYLFSLGAIRIEAIHDVRNPKSGRVMQKIGMQHEGTLRKYDRNWNGELVDAEIYSIIKGEEK